MSIVDDHLLLSPGLAGSLLTPEEFDAADIADRCYAYELIHGVLVVTPPPSEGERGQNDLLGQLLRNYRDQHPQGAALDYTLTEHTIQTRDNRRRADRVIWAGLGRTPNIRRQRPTIAIEFVSAGRRSRDRDYLAKRDEYREAGIAEYWIIDRFRRSMTVYRQPTSAAPQLTIGQDEVYSTPLLPGFELSLSRLLAEADMIEQAASADGDAQQTVDE
jgi:Uma2 family endonuclease